MSSKLAQRSELPQLPPAWRSASAATEQSDRVDGAGAASRGMGAKVAVEAFTRKLVSEGMRELIKLQDECSKILGEHRDKRERLQNELDDEVVSKAQAKDRHYDDELARLRREVGPDSGKYKDAASQAEDTAKQIREIRSRLGGRPLRTHFGWWYYIIMIFLALVEVPVNRAAFELTFREEPLFSLMLALAVGGVLIFFAHVIGIALRVWPQDITKRKIALKAITITLISSVVGFGVYFLARMRQSYMILVTQENAGFGSRLQDALQGSSTTPSNPIQIFTDAAFGIGDWMFIAVNVMLFTFGVAISFLRHDPDEDYEKAVVAARRAEQRLAKLKARYEAKEVEATKRFETMKQGLDTQMAEISAALTALHDQETRIRAHVESARKMAAQTVRARCGTFVDSFNEAADRSARTATVPPIDEILCQIAMEPMPHAV